MKNFYPVILFLMFLPSTHGMNSPVQPMGIFNEASCELNSQDIKSYEAIDMGLNDFDSEEIDLNNNDSNENHFHKFSRYITTQSLSQKKNSKKLTDSFDRSDTDDDAIDQPNGVKSSEKKPLLSFSQIKSM